MAANLDCVLLEARPALEALPDHLLHELGHLLQAKGGGGAPAQGPPPPRSLSLGAPLLHSRRPTAFIGTSGGHPVCIKNELSWCSTLAAFASSVEDSRSRIKATASAGAVMRQAGI